MVRVKKRASKRLAVAQREKIKRKVREHHRKSRKESKRNPQWKSRAKKDPGIPNSFPYKEQLLNEIEERRRLAEEQKIAAKEARQAAKLEAQEEQEQERDDDEEEDESEVSAELDTDPLPLVAPTFRGSLDDLINSKEISTIVYALDARDPASFRSTWFEQRLRSAKNKRVVLVLGRADLVPAETLSSWIAYLIATTKLPVFPVSITPNATVGVEQLVKYIQSGKHAKRDVAVVGLAHSGRTSVADAIIQQIGLPEDEDETEWPAVLDTPPLFSLRKHETVEGDQEEEQEEEDEDEDEDEDELEDEELMARIELRAMQTLMRNQGKVQRVKEPLPLVWALMSRVAHPEDLMLIFNVPAYGSYTPAAPAQAASSEEEERDVAAELRAKVHADTEEFLISLARVVGALRRKDMPDPVGAARTLLRRWADQQLGYYSKAPKVPEKADVAAARKLVDELGSEAVVPRKEWRKRWEGRELRLKPLDAVLGRDALVQDEVTLLPLEDEDEDEEDWEDEDEGEEEEEEEEDEAETEPQLPLKSILKKPQSKKAQAKRGAEEQQPATLSRKARRAEKKARVSAGSGAGAQEGEGPSGPKPGEKYDFGAFF